MSVTMEYRVVALEQETADAASERRIVLKPVAWNGVKHASRDDGAIVLMVAPQAHDIFTYGADILVTFEQFEPEKPTKAEAKHHLNNPT